MFTWIPSCYVVNQMLVKLATFFKVFKLACKRSVMKQNRQQNLRFIKSHDHVIFCGIWKFTASNRINFNLKI